MVLNDIFQDLFQNLNESTILSLPTLKRNALKINLSDCRDSRTVYKGQEPQLPFAASKIFQATISSSRRLTAIDENCKAVYEISLGIHGSNFNFRPGDTIGIICQNEQSDVSAVVQHLNIEAVVDCSYTLSIDSLLKGQVPSHLPVESTLRHVLTCCVDLRGVLKKLFLLELSRHTKEKREKRILEYLCSREGSTAYTTHILNKHICLLDIFSIFKTCKPPIDVILEYLPRLLPRPYSIVNRKCDDNIIKICFSVIDIGNNRKGLTSGWLEEILKKHLNGKFSIEGKMKNLSINDSMKIPIYMRKNVNNFRLPDNFDIPIILIGPGTGVAPFVGFLEERLYIQRNNPDCKLGYAWLFFGCKNPKLDFIYEKELKKFVSDSVLDKITISYSRYGDTDHCYVQDAIKQNGEDLVKLIFRGAHIYVCGDINKMAASVREAIVQCVANHGHEDDAEEFVARMIKEKRYILDIWN